ncbi:MAG: alpha-2-macroglobulin [Deltaproteobacteria bacterium]|nr:alpha-2-macroglobulin [Deltaproteobacteria bacterium]
MKLTVIFFYMTLLCLTAAPAAAEDTSLGELRSRAQKAYTDGNWQDAFELYRRLSLDPGARPEMAGPDFTRAWQCLRELGRLNELDDFREAVIEQHAADWRLLMAAARSYSQNTHWGYMIAGEFHRGHHRGDGKYVNAVARDRVRALQLLQQAMVPAESDPQKTEVAQFYMEFARIVQQHRGTAQAWRLQYLTDLSRLPDYEPGYGHAYGSRTRYAPVDAQGRPVYYQLPKDLNSAASDGERWRWLLARAATLDPALKASVDFIWASFLHQQFGVQTLADYGMLYGRGRAVDKATHKKDESGAYAVHTLSDDETIARLAVGVSRFDLPAEFNFIYAFKKILENRNDGQAANAARALAQIYENRRQYDRAVQYWLLYKKSNRTAAQKRIDQITQNWGVFESSGMQPAGTTPGVEYRFRNGRRVAFSAHRIRVQRLLEDVKRYIRSENRRLDWQRIDLNNIGWRIVNENQTQYVGEQVARWQLNLDPDERHWDRHVTVQFPDALKTAGAYLVTARMQDGNIARIIVWVADTVIVKKPLKQQMLYYVADAVSGQALAGVNLEFFGYRTRSIEGTHRYRILHRELTMETDPNGLVIVGSSQMAQNMSWLATATTRAGRLAFLGFSSVWYPNYDDTEYHQTKTLVMTDRPVYRPGQTVKFKAWVRHARYDKDDTSAFAGLQFNVRIHNPKNEQIYSQHLTADAYGGITGEFTIPAEAPLGEYRISHGRSSVYGGQTFRVEEYKKPEFEVSVEAPAEPVMLGEKISATIKATYYFGSPVTDARVKYKVLRSEHDSRWYPRFYWDWFYGPGYWWYAYDYPWYPGWKDWGCLRPIWSWWPQQPTQPPEIVADGEVNIGRDGTVKIPIDTTLAKLIHGDSDHRYTITAEVRDQSRRTIVGQGQVLVARKAFKVYAWLDRGHYRVGDTINASFKAQTLSQDPVAGRGRLKLLRITHRNNQPLESEVASWDLNTDDQGHAALKIQASLSGQYRLSYTVTDTKGHAIEGGYIFTVRGRGDDAADYRFAKIELIADKAEYVPGDTVLLQINTDRAGAAVVFFVRPANGIYLPPKVITPRGKSAREMIHISKKDMPNFFVEAFTVYDGKVHTEVREIAVPPEKRVLNVSVTPARKDYRPGQTATLSVRLTDFNGEPFQGSAVISVYDRAVEYISGGSNVPEIRSFFWKWRRQHQSYQESSLERWFANLLKKNEPPMKPIGVFGDLIITDTSGNESAVKLKEARSQVALEAGAARSPGPAEAALEDKTAETDLSADGELVQPAVRSKLSDTAFWSANIMTNAQGMADVAFKMPENLTGWQVKVWAMGHGTRVGQGDAEWVTRKDLIVRLQAPRFFVETDEVVLSANVHNYLKRRKSASVRLELDGGCLALINGQQQTRSISVEADGEQRVDWRVRVIREGEAVVRMLALTDEESDAMQMGFPVYVHGMLKQVPKSGVMRADQTRARIQFQVPAARRADQSRLELRYSPTLAGAMVDALPYLVSYPYGCTEQTLNRFLPTVITQQALKRMGLDLAAIQNKRANLNPQEIGADTRRAAQWQRYDHNPVFDEDQVASMVAAGIRRLVGMQLSDGGWGWFSGYGEQSYPHTTALVVHGLQIARQNGVTLPEQVLARGIQWLKDYQAKEIERLRLWDRTQKKGKSRADNLDALVYMVLTDAAAENKNMRAYLYRDRNSLAVYAKALFGLALATVEDNQKLAMMIQNIEQFLVVDDENQTAYLNLPNSHYWWYWYGSETEAHAYYLKLLARTDPAGKKAPGLVKYLLNNRKHATYWNSTRDTALVVEAFADYLAASGEAAPDITLDIHLNDQKVKTVRMNAQNLFTFDHKWVLEGQQIHSGTQTITLEKSGRGPLYFNAYLDYFSLEDFITAEGLEIKVERRVFRLTESDKKMKDAGSRGQVVDRRVEKYERRLIDNGATLKSGELIEVELIIESKNDYEYVVFEDMKAAGFEPVEMRSGYTGNEMGAYVEFRDQKVAFFVHQLARGKHSVSYRLRAEIPGKFSALPARAYAMYAPELKANSDEIKLMIKDE